MKYCQQCGAQLEDEMKFCVYCGATTEEAMGSQQEQNPWSNYNSEAQRNGMNQQNNQNATAQGGGYAGSAGTPAFYAGGNYRIEKRSIALSIILSVITCGIYTIYWIVKLNDEINQLAGEQDATSGGMVILLSIVTCGIYSWYWLYKMGERCDKIKGVNGSSGIIYIVLAIFALSIVDYCLIQDTINKSV